ncbi:VanZ family protein [Kineosporia mesophila]|uniref:VanZ family protein n=1 Tax=Kineosporia mesophila TaxID=566012 RepID=UPI001E446C83|nr:VanZ family protein [Kineosporia mesophila]
MSTDSLRTTSAPDPVGSGFGAASPWRRTVLVLTLVLHLIVLYAPRAPGTGGLPVDKVVHATIFGGLLWAAARANLRLRPVALALAGHAVASELLQHFVLPNRSGDPADVVADLVGVVIVTAILWRRG